MKQLSFQGVAEDVKGEWLEQCRVAAKILLKTRPYITSKDVTDIVPRPILVHRNTTGKIFNSKDFKVVGFQKSEEPSRKGAIVSQWALRDDIRNHTMFNRLNDENLRNTQD